MLTSNIPDILRIFYYLFETTVFNNGCAIPIGSKGLLTRLACLFTRLGCLFTRLAMLLTRLSRLVVNLSGLVVNLARLSA